MKRRKPGRRSPMNRDRVWGEVVRKALGRPRPVWSRTGYEILTPELTAWLLNQWGARQALGERQR